VTTTLSAGDAVVAADMIRQYFVDRVTRLQSVVDEAIVRLDTAVEENYAQAAGAELTLEQAQDVFLEAERIRAQACLAAVNDPTNENRAAFDAARARQEILRRYLRVQGFPF
jgi:hypothetical protein